MGRTELTKINVYKMSSYNEIDAKEHVQVLQDEGIWLIGGDQGVVQHRGKTTCEDIQNFPASTCVHVEINADGFPCNFEATLLASYLGVLAKDPTIAPISFEGWRKHIMLSFKNRLLEEVEVKVEFPRHIRPWILSFLGVKWRVHKTKLKSAHMDYRPIQDIIHDIPEGIDAIQWAHLMTRWSNPRDKERASQNSSNAKQQKCPHTMGRKSAVHRQQEAKIGYYCGR